SLSLSHRRRQVNARLPFPARCAPTRSRKLWLSPENRKLAFLMAIPFNAFRSALVLMAAAAFQYSAAAAPDAGAVEHDGCYARWDQGRLTVGNTRFEGRWSMQGGTLRAISFQPKGEREWLAPPKAGKTTASNVLKVHVSEG